ncbi:MAG: hypothetical protein IKD43_03200 [Clostridia bacterium]|nr:hypothetical protein [Clostridia bacterium]
MLHFVVNPNAKNINHILDAIKVRMQEEGIEYGIHAGASKEETRLITAQLTQSPATIVAVGGDGTLNDVLSGITMPETTVLGLIPVGTGNDFAATAGIPEGLPALELILSGEPKFTDYLECGGGLRSMNVAGLGIDVDTLERTYRMKRGSKKGKYLRGLIGALFSFRGQEIEVTENGETYTINAYIAAACNGRQFGGGLRICPPAELGDGKFDLVVVETPKFWKLPKLLIKLLRGKILEEPIARHVLCEEARIRQLAGKYVQLDGELVASETLNVKIVSGKLRMFRG